MRVNIYTERLVRVWLMLDPKDDLEIVACDVDEELGQPPEWFTYESGEGGWEMILNVPWLHSSKDAEGNDWVESRLLWGLQEGIAPGQPFLVEFPCPHYTVSQTMDGTEYDTDYDNVDIIQILPWSQKRIATAWEKELRATLQYRKATASYRRKLREKQRSDVKSMYILTSHFCLGHCEPDWCSGPHGLRIALCSTATIGKRQSASHCTTTLLTGESPQCGSYLYPARAGEREEALKDLIKKAKTELPHLTEEQIRKMDLRFR